LRDNEIPCSEQPPFAVAKYLGNPQKMPFSHAISRFQNVLKIEKMTAYLDFQIFFRQAARAILTRFLQI
jgi:hypothetical protein